MPNTARGGGISRKITSGEDRKRLKEIAQELEVPEGMGVIVRTAGASAPSRDQTRLRISAAALGKHPRPDPALDGAGADLRRGLLSNARSATCIPRISTRRSSPARGLQRGRDFMRMLMPSQAKK